MKKYKTKYLELKSKINDEKIGGFKPDYTKKSDKKELQLKRKDSEFMEKQRSKMKPTENEQQKTKELLLQLKRKDSEYMLESMSQCPRIGNLRSKFIGTYMEILPDINLRGDTIEIMKEINKPYSKRPRGTEDLGNGIYYADDYLKEFNLLNNNFSKLNGITNDYYWDWGHTCEFKIKDNVSPSDALNALLIGPTFADCGNAIQICVYQMILNLVGKEKFNELFGKPLCQFLITKWLYGNFCTIFDNNDKYAPGNPLDFLFDVLENIIIEDLQHGDIVYIKGIDYYDFKHLAGFMLGFNLFCDKIDNEIKFIGFGPTTFEKGLLTYDGIRKILIDGYNENQSYETIRIIQESEPLISSTVDPSDPMQSSSKAELAKRLANDKVSINSPIGGLVRGIRLNKEKLNEFINYKWKSWHKLDEEYYNKIFLSLKPKKIDIEFKIPFSAESADKTFDTYQVNNETQKKMYNLSKKFAMAVSMMNPASGAIGFIMSGTPGIGKTHLGVSIAKFTNQYGKKVLYVDEDYVTDLVQLSKGKLANFSDWFHNIDLIILDDLNSDYGIGQNFFKQAINYVITNSKAILISSNKKVIGLYEALPRFIQYNDPIADNFLSLYDINLDSIRKPWIKNIKQATMKTLAEYIGQQAAGIIVAEAKQNRIINLSKYAKEYSKMTNIKLEIRIVQDPYDERHIVSDLYVHDAKNYDISIINVYTDDDAEQLFNLIPQVHNKGSKIIVISQSIEKFAEIIKLYQNKIKPEIRPRLMERFKIIFPGII